MAVLLLGSFALLGAVVASFIGVLSERIHTGQAWVRSRSRCNSCARTLDAFDLVPILSWLAALGRCRTCRSRIPAAYLLLETVLAALFALSVATLGLTLPLLPFLVALSVLAFIVVYDVRHTLVPPSASAALIVAALCFVWLTAPSLLAFGSALMWAGGIALGFLALHVFSKGKAMGLGDAPVSFALSLLAAPYAFSGLLFSFWIGGLFGIAILGMRRGGPTMGIEVPFVPFMAAGFLLAYFIQWNPLAL